MKNIYNIFYLFFFYLLIAGCKKENLFLDVKPNDALEIPSSLNDLQLILQDESVFNNTTFPALGELSTDDYYVANSLLSSNAIDRNCYKWLPQIFNAGQNDPDWADPYTQVYYANTVLDYLPKIGAANGQQSLYNQIEGSALFFRAIAFYGLVQTFALPYNTTTANTDLGISLRLTSDLNAKSTRSNVQASYSQILQDLKQAASILPPTGNPVTRPSKAAAFGLLARVYQVMGNVTASFGYADSCLAIYNTLQDFNNLKPAAFPAYPNYSPEEIYHCSMESYTLNGFSSLVDSNLYRMFSDPNDLRPGVFFRHHAGLIGFLSQFDKKSAIYCGISTNEIYLIKAECEARQNDPASAMADLNTLLQTRWKAGTYTPLQASNSDDAMAKILTERRKELVMTGLRWSDLRRLNMDSRFAVTLNRVAGGVTYTLPPNDPRYALPIPPNEIAISGIQQNPR